MKKLLIALLLLFVPTVVGAAERRENQVPPRGLAISGSSRNELQEGANRLRDEIELLRREFRSRPALLELLPDVQIFHKAVDWALRYDEFYRSNEVTVARTLLKQGVERARLLRAGQAPWLTATGLSVRGFVSKLDQSIQPYGLVIPSIFTTKSNDSSRLDVWLHGRDNQLTELKFIADRQRSVGEFAPTNAIVLHPYGRYCNAFKFAGETDVFEAIDQVKRTYRINDRKIVLRGFSMGGAGVWHLAAHHPGVWAAAAPGAGFAETAEYQKLGANRARFPWWEQRLWQLYDAPDYAANFLSLPLIAYNGTDDPQRQAADVMERALRQEGLPLTRVWGTNVGHKYTPEARHIINEFVDEAVERSKVDFPPSVHLTTRTAAYGSNAGVAILRLEHEWRRADLLLNVLPDQWLIRVTNVALFSVERPPTESPSRISINGEWISHASDKRMVFQKDSDGQWRIEARERSYLAKRSGLQGPIDAAFMDRFLFVRPTGQSQSPQVAAWITARMAQASNEWRAQFRGDVRVKDDVNVTDADLTQNLILWGDPRSNRLLARIVRRLPIRWNDESIRIRGRTFPSDTHVPALIYPNPLSPGHYIVVNSGFTFAAAGSGSNAQQTPKLPDYAIFDLEQNGTVVLADFFDERWQVK